MENKGCVKDYAAFFVTVIVYRLSILNVSHFCLEARNGTMTKLVETLDIRHLTGLWAWITFKDIKVNFTKE